MRVGPRPELHCQSGRIFPSSSNSVSSLRGCDLYTGRVATILGYPTDKLTQAV
jgi:hypothetical protein